MKCLKCIFISPFWFVLKHSEMGYWIFTEIYCLVHRGDACEKRND